VSTAAQLLGYIEGQARIARAALADEHEGMLREAVLQLQADADTLAELVTTW
jgi:hypothetical protein